MLRRWGKWALIVGVLLAILVVVAAIAVPLVVDTPRIQAYIASNATQTLGRPVKFASVSLRVLPLPAVVLHGLEVAEDPKFGTTPFLRLETGHVRLRLLPLLTGRVELGRIVLRKPAIAIIQGADGKLNISTLGATSEPKVASKPGRASGGSSSAGAVAVTKVSVDDGVVTYVAPGKGGGAPAQYRLTGVDLTLTGGGTQLAFKGDAKLQPGDVALAVRDGLVALGGTRTLSEASLRGKVSIDGKDVAPAAAALAGPSPAFGGAMKGTLVLGGTVGAPTAAGEIEMAPLTVTQTNASCPEPKRRTLTVPSLKLNAAYQDPQLTGKPVTASVAGGTVTTQLSVTLDRGVRVQMTDLAIKSLALEKVLVDYLCQGYAITGPLDLTGGFSFEARDALNTLSGPGQLRVGRGKVVGSQALALVGNVVRLGGALSSILSGDPSAARISGDSPLDFDSITATYTITNGVATTRDLLYTSRGMKVALAGDYGLATGRLNIDMTVDAGKNTIKAKVTGTTANPSISIANASLKDFDPKQAEKGLQDLLRRFKK